MSKLVVRPLKPIAKPTPATTSTSSHATTTVHARRAANLPSRYSSSAISGPLQDVPVNNTQRCVSLNRRKTGSHVGTSTWSACAARPPGSRFSRRPRGCSPSAATTTSRWRASPPRPAWRKQTIYRWWPSKGALVAECLLEGMLLPERLVPPDTGDIRADLIAWLEEIFRVLESPTARACCVRSSPRPPRTPRWAAPRRQPGRACRSCRGSTPRTRHPESTRGGREVVEALVGAVVLRALSRTPIEPGDAERLVSAVVGPHPS